MVTRVVPRFIASAFSDTSEIRSLMETARARRKFWALDGAPFPRLNPNKAALDP